MTIDKQRLLELSERGKALSGPDREVDLAIAEAMTAERQRNGSINISCTYTASLDAALTLLADKLVYLEFRRFDDGTWGCDLEAIGVKVGSISAVAATKELAFCAAALRALSHTASIEEKG